MTVIDLVGNTPLIHLSSVSQETGVPIFAKAEFLNPSGSVKDRAAKNMILDGISRGVLTKGKTIIDATSGNTGIAYAMLGSALGFKVKIYLPANASIERKNIMKHYGAEIVETDPLESSDGAYLAAKEEAEAHPETYFYPDQYNNPANYLAHYNGMANEIWEQTNGKITHFICSMGTSGTFTGTSKKLKELNPNIHTIAVQPDSPMHGIEGTKHYASTIIPCFYDANLPEYFELVSTKNSYSMTRRLAKTEGIYAGISSGANSQGAFQLAQKIPENEKKNSLIVTILCDSGSRYVSDEFWG
ncbi:cysteine synthase [Fibrobacterales bacterium]|nr:cysteine synthase [Fibrobacterales bacterium]